MRLKLSVRVSFVELSNSKEASFLLRCRGAMWLIVGNQDIGVGVNKVVYPLLGQTGAQYFYCFSGILTLLLFS